MNTQQNYKNSSKEYSKNHRGGDLCCTDTIEMDTTRGHMANS